MDDTELSNQKRLERFKSELDRRLELLRATTAFEHAALKPTSLLNGGALVATLAIVGSFWREGTTPSALPVQLWVAIGIWCAGVVFSAVAFGFGYFSQWSFYKSQSRWIEMDMATLSGQTDVAAEQARLYHQFAGKGSCLRGVAYFVAGGSLFFFVCGTVLALLAVT